MATSIVVAIGIATIILIYSSVLSSEGSVGAIIDRIVVSLTIALRVWIGAGWWGTGSVMATSIIVAIGIATIILVHSSVLSPERSVGAIIDCIVVSLTIALHVWVGAL